MLKNNCIFQVRHYDDVGTAMTTKYSCYYYYYFYCYGYGYGYGYYHCHDSCCCSDVEHSSHFCCYKNVTFQLW